MLLIADVLHSIHSLTKYVSNLTAVIPSDCTYMSSRMRTLLELILIVVQREVHRLADYRMGQVNAMDMLFNLFLPRLDGLPPYLI
jgi:hypothetical protein